MKFTFWIWLLQWPQASGSLSIELGSLDRRGRGEGDFIIASVSASRRDSLDKSGLFPEWKKMSAPKSQVEKVSFIYWLVDLCLSFVCLCLCMSLSLSFTFLRKNLNQEFKQILVQIPLGAFSKVLVETCEKIGFVQFPRIKS